MKKTVFVGALVCLFTISGAQNYQAIHGSPYAGSLGIYNNPASGNHSHYNWDITLFSVQLKSSTNAFSSTEPLIRLPDANVYLSNGDKQRFVHLSQDLHVLNTRFKLNSRRAVAFGFNARNYVHIKSKPFKFIDTISSINSFLQFNRPAPSMGGRVINNSWAEIYVSYSEILWNSNLDQLSAGITLKGVRGISGLYLQLDKMQFTEITQPGSASTFVVTDPNGRYGYSSNYDKLQDNNSSDKNRKDFLKYTQGSLGIDLGVEYLLKNDYAPQYDDVEKFEYNWKIGVSMLDLGKNLFKHGKFSRQFNGVLTDVSEEDLENKFSSPDDIEDFYDSLQTVVQQLQSSGPDFYIWQPTRLVVNVDKPIIDHFYINGELSINFFSTQNKEHLHTRELNLLTVTPRWETSLLGLYLPVQLNTQGQLWVGSAFKAGPLLMGIHDWRWLFSKNRAFNGGAYIAIVVRNFFSSSEKTRRIKNMDCPPSVW
ncbi:MAG: hypothetical protein H7122_16770 [Chitinophagaceae bacterium]|nr:hypothetical protein [Chitinophagaceae bacterium]